MQLEKSDGRTARHDDEAHRGERAPLVDEQSLGRVRVEPDVGRKRQMHEAHDSETRLLAGEGVRQRAECEAVDDHDRAIVERR